MGLEINSKRARYDYVVVRAIKANEQLDRFNSGNPALACRTGDRIEGVNGMKGAKEIISQLQTSKALKIEFARVGDGDDKDASD